MRLKRRAFGSTALLSGCCRPKAGTKQTNTLKISTDSTFARINNELSPLFDPPVYFRIEGPGAIGGQLALDIPELDDGNGDGFEDFFEVDQRVNAVTSDGFFSPLQTAAACQLSGTEMQVRPPALCRSRSAVLGLSQTSSS